MNVELSAAAWYKSSKSGDQEACVEVAHLDGDLVGVRDSKDPSGPALVFEPAAWDAFTSGVRDRQFDLP